MSILNITTETPGLAGVIPRLVHIQTSDTLAEITADNYLQGAIAQGFTFYQTDLFAISDSSNVSRFFVVTITSSDITLTQTAGSVTSDVVSGHFANFDGTSGNLSDAGFSPSDATKTKVAMVSAATTSGNVAQFNDITGTVGNGPVAANKLLTSSFATPDTSANLVTFDVTCGQASLAAAGSVVLIDSSGSKQYKIRALQINSGGTNFSGGGGNRLGQVTDGTTVYSVVPAASLQTLANAQWGATAIPNPASAAINTSTAAGADLVFKYSGGTTDYTAGSVVISGIAERIA